MRSRHAVALALALALGAAVAAPASARVVGGDVRFVQVPPHGADGHALFTRGAEVWQPVVAEFLRERGFAMPVDRP